MSSLVEQRLGQYHIISLLGEGGMASVYRARQESIQRDVAIKVIRPELASAKDFLARFAREAQTVASLSHPHILKVFDYGQHEQTAYLVMELISGGSLAEQISNGALSVETTLRIVEQLASALDYAHEQGIIHRDLKPQNILLDGKGNAILTDFGLAKLLDTDRASLTQSGTQMGTPNYMAPEQWRGDPVDARTDVYALGIITFEMLTGHRPFKGDTAFNIMHKHMYESVPSVEEYRPGLPAGLDSVFKHALAKESTDRYPSASAFARVLGDMISGTVTEIPSGLSITPVSDSQAAQQEQQAIQQIQAELIGRTTTPVKSRVVNSLPQDVSERFIGRTKEQADIQNLLLEKTRLISVYGRSGVGKTALVSKVLSDLQNITDGGQPFNMVYLSSSTTGISFARIMADFAKLFNEETREMLNAILRDGNAQLPQKISRLLDSMTEGRYILLLDGLEALQQPETGEITDPDLKAFIDTAINQGSALRIVITSREPLALPRTVKTWERLIPIEEGLAVDESIQLLRTFDPDGAAGLKAAPNDSLRILAEKTDGIPRALEAIAGLLLEDPLLSLDDLVNDVALLTGEITSMMVQAGISKLDPKATRVMEALALFGRPVTQAGLELLLAPYMDTSSLRTILSRLVRAYYVVFNKTTQCFNLHQLDRSYCYSLIPDGQSGDGLQVPLPYTRRALHARAAEFYKLQRKPKSDWHSPEDFVPQLAEIAHRIEAGDYDNAARLVLEIDRSYLWEMGQKAILYNIYLRLYGHIQDQQLAGQCLIRLGWAIWPNMDKVREIIDEGLDIARRLNDKATEAAALDGLAQVHRFQWNMPESLKLHKQAAALYRELGDEIGLGDSLGGIATAYQGLSRDDLALDYLRQALEVSQRVGNQGSLNYIHWSMGQIYANHGEFDTAINYLEKALKGSRELHSYIGQLQSLAMLGFCYAWLNELEKAYALFQEALVCSGEMGSHVSGMGSLVHGGLGYTYLIDGNFEKASEHLRIGLSATQTNPLAITLCSMFLTLTLLELNDPTSAYEVIQAAKNISLPPYIPQLLCIEGVALAQLGKRDEAKANFEKSIMLVKELIAQTPDQFDFWYALGLSYTGLAFVSDVDINEAVEAFQTARIKNSSPGFVRQIGVILDILVKAPGGKKLAPAYQALTEK